MRWLLHKARTGAAGVWGAITGNIQDQTDLIQFINGKLATKGVYTVMADGGENMFAVTHNLGVKPASVNLLAANANSSSLSYYVDDISSTTTTFTIAFPSAPPAGELIFYWQAFRSL